MKEEISFSQFCDRFRDMNRDNNFSYEGKKALFDYLEALEEDTDTEIELDIIALCCEYSEYEDMEEFLKDYSNTLIKTDRDDFEKDDEEGYKEALLEELEEHTTVIKIDDDKFIIQCF